MSNSSMDVKSESAVTTSQSQEPLVNTSASQEPTPTDSTSSGLRASIRRLTHKTRSHQQSSDTDGKQKTSISDSGPFSIVVDPATGKEVLKRNPHWPNEDSGRKEKESEGEWAFGSMMGQSKDDFGGTVG
jgi:hypothetical protein